MKTPLKLLSLYVAILITNGCAKEAQDQVSENSESKLVVEESTQQQPLQLIAFGSCSLQMRDIPMFNTVVDANPDVFLMIGDVVYPDVNDEATGLLDPWPSDESVARMKQVYAQMAAKPEFQNLKSNVPMMAVWDDHDYGFNDGDSSFVLKEESQQLFLDFFDEPADSERRNTPGIFDAKIMGPEGKRVQIILLDTRYFRSVPVADTRSQEEKNILNIAGRYLPSEDPTATIFGDVQWAWLEEQLRKPAELRFLVTSYPLVAQELGRDAWGNFPLERTKMFDTIDETNANGVVILTSDVHHAEISATDEGPYPLVEFTSSPMGAPAGANAKYKNSRRILGAYSEDNFGLIVIDWDAQPSPQVVLKTIALNGEPVMEHAISLDSLRKQ